MSWFIPLGLGLLFWSGSHLMKRVAPDLRARLGAGDAGRGPVALGIFLGLVLMAIGIRGAPYIPVWTPPAFLTHLNNLMVLIAFYLMAIAGQGVWLDRKMRHPMLTGIKLWAVAHLLVNGDLVSMLLFGGLLAWAVVEVVLINRAQPDWTPPPPAPQRKEITFPIATLAVFAIIAWVHTWLGYYPFGG